ncbi:hypothetical protein [Actinorhabdospora filicis]|uniref:hypothetical protein n=1 Tax=Actinorhabdospora filicis TaxID=1785913 RepID=UPI002553EB09|nr:hypothetical protein [Actinorhabdospora filicis]
MSLSGLPAVREHWAAPGEPILWMLPYRRTTYEMKGRKGDGRPADGLGTKIVKGAGLLALAATAPSDGGSGDGPQPPPAVIAWADRPQCLAAALADLPGESRDRGFWVATPGRFAFLAPPPEPPVRRSLLKQVTGFAQDVVAAFKPEPPFAPGRPIPTVPLTPVLECPWTDGGDIVRKMRRRTVKEPVYRRILLPDGSGFDYYRDAKKSLLPAELTSRLHRIA